MMWGLALIALVLALVINEYGKQWIDRRIARFTPSQKTQYENPLVDIVHDQVSDRWRPYRWIPDVIHTIFIGVGLFVPFYADNYEFDFFLFNVSCEYILRILLCMCTILPRCRVYDERDHHRPHSGNRPKWFLTVHRIWFVASKGHGNDLYLSGHCIMVFSLVWTWTHYQVFPYVVLVGCWVTAFLMAWMIVMTRCHYVNDNVLAFFIVCGWFEISTHHFYPWYTGYHHV